MKATSPPPGPQPAKVSPPALRATPAATARPAQTPEPEPPLPALSVLLDRLYLACIWTAGTAIVGMSLIIPWGVFSRYVLGRGSQWPEPIAILLMLVFTFIGAAAAYRAGGHIAVSVLTDRLPPRLHRPAALLADALVGLLCGFVVVYGTRLVRETMGQSIAELPWLPVGITYVAIPLGALATLLFVLERMRYGPQHKRALLRVGEAS